MSIRKYKKKVFDTSFIGGGNTKTKSKVTTSNGSYDVLVEHRPDLKAVYTTDSYSNALARLGAGTDNIINAGDYVPTYLDDGGVKLTTLYRFNWVVRNLIEAVPNDITKKWFNLKSNLSPAELEKMNKLYRETNLRNKLNEGMRWGRLYGGAIGIILIKGQEHNLDEPLNYDQIGVNCFKGLWIVDRYRATPSSEIDTDISSPNFGKPIYYNVSDSTIDLTVRVHYSKVIRFLGRPLPIIEKQREMNWGASEVESVYREMMKRDASSENIASLLFKANLSVHKIKNLDQIFSMNSIQAQERFWSLMESISTIESNMGVRLISSEDDVQFLNYSFAGIKDVYEGIMMDLSGACRIPATKLFGRSPAGMNATGESDLQNYYDYIDEVRESQFREQIQTLLPILSLSCWGTIPPDLDFEFEEMASMNESEKAQILQQKTSIIVETFNSNLITREVAQKELKSLSDQYGMFDTITDKMIKESVDQYASDLQGGGMDDPMAGMMGGMGGMSGLMGGNAQDDYTALIPNYQSSSNIEDSIENSEEVVQTPDDFEKKLLELKRQIMLEGNNKSYSLTNDDFSSENNEDVDTLLLEYERLEKMLKSIQKDYESAQTALWSYPDQNSIPLNHIELYNRLKNQFINAKNALKNVETKIINNGGKLELMKYTGEFDDVMDEINEDLMEIKQQASTLMGGTYGY